jgi:bla regulator protein blaR1
MIPNYLSKVWQVVAPAVGNHLWQSTLFAVVAGLLTLLLRKNHARARYWLWLVASLKFLIPFSLLAGVGSHVIGSDLGWSHVAAQTKADFYFAMDEFSQPFTQPVQHVVSRNAPVPAPQFSVNLMHQLPAILAAVWLLGFAVVICVWCVRWRRMCVAMRMAVPLNEGREVETLRRLERADGMRKRIKILLTRTSLEPGIFGIVRPVLLWPAGISQRLEDAHVESIVAHELRHVRRRDNLTAALHMLVEAIFWFHPGVWWLGKRLVVERECACDEEVLELGSDREVYAESILKICEFCVASPLECVSGVTGADLKKRIVRIMTEHVSRKLNFSKKLLLTATGLAAIAVPVVFGLAHAMPSRAQSANAAVRPQFDVASVKPCDKNSPPPPSAGRGGGGGPASGRMDLPCSTVTHLIEVAYVEFPDGVRQPRLAFKPLPIEGGPGWLKSDTVLISAETEASPTPTQTMMQGPMLQMILEDRFKLKVHRETREVPVYELTVAKGGLKIQHTVPGSCAPDNLQNVGRRPEPGEKPLCAMGMRRTDAPNVTIWSRGMTLNQICHYLDGIGIDRPLIDKTGVADTELFDIQLQFSIDDSTPGLHPHDTGDDTGAPGGTVFPSLFTAIQQLGLKLVPAKGPAKFLVIDSVERLSGN